MDIYTFLIKTAESNDSAQYCVTKETLCESLRRLDFCYNWNVITCNLPDIEEELGSGYTIQFVNLKIDDKKRNEIFICLNIEIPIIPLES